MAFKSPFTRLSDARERHARVLAVLASDTSRSWAVLELHDELRRWATVAQVRSAITCLTEQRLIKRADSNGKTARYRVVVVEQRKAVG